MPQLSLYIILIKVGYLLKCARKHVVQKIWKVLFRPLSRQQTIFCWNGLSTRFAWLWKKSLNLFFHVTKLIKDLAQFFFRFLSEARIPWISNSPISPWLTLKLSNSTGPRRALNYWCHSRHGAWLMLFNILFNSATLCDRNCCFPGHAITSHRSWLAGPPGWSTEGRLILGVVFWRFCDFLGGTTSSATVLD